MSNLIGDILNIDTIIESIIAGIILLILQTINKRNHITERFLNCFRRIVNKEEYTPFLSEDEMNYFNENHLLDHRFIDGYYLFFNDFYHFCEQYENENDVFYLELNQLKQAIEPVTKNPNLDINHFSIFEEFRRNKIKYETDIISKITNLFQKSRTNNNRIQNDYSQLELKYKRLINNMRKIDPQNEYVDFNDKKLKRDINEYESYMGYWDSSNKYIIDKIKHRITDLRNKRKGPLSMLDIGGGNGKVISELSQDNDEIMFIEPDPNRMHDAEEILNKKKIRVNYYKQKFEDINWINNENRPFDVIICSHVIQHISTKLYIQLISEINNLLTDKGLFFLMCPLAFGKNNEYVVHGLEFDVWKLYKNDFGLNNNLNIYKILEKCNLTIPTHNLSQKIKDNYIVFRDKVNDDDILYALREEKDCYLFYHRVNEGLIASFKKNNKISVVYDEVRKYLGFDFRQNSKFTWYSRQWQIEENQLAVLDSKNNEVNIYPIKEILENHYYYNEQITKNWEIPTKFCSNFDNASKLALFSTDQENRWRIFEGDTEIALIIKTRNHFFLIDNGTNNIINTLPYDDFKSTYSNCQFLDSEFYDGLIIPENNSYRYFLRFDNDWLRLFKGSCVGKEEIEPIFNANINHWKGNEIQIESVKKNYIWNIRRYLREKHNDFFPELPNPLLPDYNVLHIIDNNKPEKYFIYRDKRYTRLCKEHFNKLCNGEANRLKILPTHHFVYNKLVDDLKQCGLKQVSFFSYHLGAKLKLWGRSKHLGGILYSDKTIFLRDKFFNYLHLNRFKYFRKIFEARDCLFILKKTFD